MAIMAATGKQKLSRFCCQSSKPSAPAPKNPKLGGSQAPQMKNCRNIITPSLKRIEFMEGKTSGSVVER
jgi:hypothetical protein